MPVQLERNGRIGVVTLNRPAKRNAIDSDTASALSIALDELEADDELWCGVLTGTGGFFSAGTDLNEAASPRTEAGGEYGIIRRTRSKPLIAAVEGGALGGGFEIALACDLIVAGEQSRFGLPEVAIGVIATCGGLFRGPRALPLNVAREMALVGRPLGADRLHQLGVVNQLVPDGSALDAAIEIGRHICSNSPISVRETLTAINRLVSHHDDEAWSFTDTAIRAIASSPDLTEGRASFFARRTPEWAGLTEHAATARSGHRQPGATSLDSAARIAAESFAAYCHALDHGGPEELRRLFHVDVTLEVPGTTHYGIDAVLRSFDGYFATSQRTTRHHISNVRIIDRQADRITAEASLLALTAKDGTVSIASGRYRDELEWDGVTWLIAHKRIGLDIPFTRISNATPTTE